MIPRIFPRIFNKGFLPITMSLLILLTGCSSSPSQPTPTPTTPVIPPSGYEPTPSDASLKRDQVFIDLDNSHLVVSDSQPVLVGAVIKGTLPDPCHHPRVVVTPAAANNHINLEVYSVYDPSTVCITMVQPFEAAIPLGSYSGGHYSVYVNGELLTGFDS